MARERENTRIRVLIADDHAAVRRGIRAYLTVLDDFVVVADAADGREALDTLCSLATACALPDLVLLDLRMPVLDGVTVTKEITDRYPRVGVVALTGLGQAARVHAALTHGALTALRKDITPAHLAAVLRTAVHGIRDAVPGIRRGY